MTRRGWVLGLLTGAALVCLGGCGDTSRNVLHYKMTVTVQTPEGVRSGSSVRAMGLNTNNIMGHAIGDIQGEAAVIDLPHGQTLFALLTGGDGEVDYAMQIGGRAEVWGKSPAEPRTTPVELYPTHPNTVHLMNTNPLPMLVRFKDIRDPTSVEKVDPADLAASFGPGYALKTISIVSTSEPVTTGIEKRLGWLDQHWNLMLDGHRYNDSPKLSNSLASGSFSTGNMK